MCDPMTIGLIGTAVSMVGTGFSALQASQQARYQEKVAKRNVDLSNEAAQREQANTREAALQHYREVARLKGAQRAQMSANGIDINFGSAADVQGDTEMLAREDTKRLYDQGFEKARGFEIEASNFGGAANAAKANATGALIGGALGMADTALGSASQYYKPKSKMGVVKHRGSTTSQPTGHTTDYGF